MITQWSIDIVRSLPLMPLMFKMKDSISWLMVAIGSQNQRIIGWSQKITSSMRCWWRWKRMSVTLEYTLADTDSSSNTDTTRFAVCSVFERPHNFLRHHGDGQRSFRLRFGSYQPTNLQTRANRYTCCLGCFLWSSVWENNHGEWQLSLWCHRERWMAVTPIRPTFFFTSLSSHEYSVLSRWQPYVSK